MTKSFAPGRKVLDSVDFEVGEGEIHALLGENGAGKTTLMRVLTGLVRPDSGALELFGSRVDLSRFAPAVALAAGVRMVHQHSALVPALDVPQGTSPEPSAVDATLAAHGARVVDFAAWQRLDRLEVERGKPHGRPRVKFGPVAEMLAALDASRSD